MRRSFMALKMAAAAAAVLIATVQADPARAAAVASVTPSTLTAALGSTLPRTLTWTVNVTNVLAANGAPVAAGLMLASPQGVVSGGGQVLQIDPIPLIVTLSAAGQGSATESFTLSPATIAAAQRMGIGTLLLQRSFSLIAAKLSAVATVSIDISGNAGGPIAISRVALHFEDRELRRVLTSGDSALAIADVNFSGSGVLNAIWEVASPPSTLGQPVFVPLATSVVTVSGGGLTEITSPPLPSRMAGNYLVRFRIRSPVVPFEGLTLQYAVTGDENGVAPIAILSPEHFATLEPGTRFTWQPAPGATAYRIEFYDPSVAESDQPPVMGQWIAGATRDAGLSPLAQTHLKSGREYRWRIVAIDEGNEVVGRSSLYEIRTP